MPMNSETVSKLSRLADEALTLALEMEAIMPPGQGEAEATYAAWAETLAKAAQAICSCAANHEEIWPEPPEA